MGVRHIGEAVELKEEFQKTGNATRMFLRKLRGSLLGAGEIPLPALDDFEPAARRTLELAPEEARHFNHAFVGTEHILLGLMRSESKSLSNVMRRLGVGSAAVRLEIEQIVTAGTGAVGSTTIPFTPRARRALRLAAQEAKSLSERQVSAEQVFLGLLREGGGVAAMVLKKLGVRAESVRAEILKETKARRGAG
jgi:ATP-dependent Clp protease ATP-binding subunit ClpC